MHFKWRRAGKKHEKKKRKLPGYLLGVIPKALVEIKALLC